MHYTVFVLFCCIPFDATAAAATTKKTDKLLSLEYIRCKIEGKERTIELVSMKISVLARSNDFVSCAKE